MTGDEASLTRSEPRHRVIARQIQDEILTGRMRSGDRLAGENALARRFDVSRGTVRKALAWLAEERLIDTRSGSGSFVAFDGQQVDTAEGWSSALLSAGVVSSSTILRCEVRPDPELSVNVRSATLNFLFLDRIRRIEDGTAVSIERSRLPAVGRIADVPALGLVNDSLAATMREAELVPRHGDQWAQVTSLDAEDAAHLGMHAGDPVLHTMSTAWSVDGAFVERVTSLLDPAHFRLRMTFEIGA